LLAEGFALEEFEDDSGEVARGSPAGYPHAQPYRWWRRHDEYEDA
jgi:hypothetical protein